MPITASALSEEVRKAIQDETRVLKKTQEDRSGIIGRYCSTDPIYGHDGFVISNKQEPLGHADGERECLEKWGYHVQMLPPTSPMDDPRGAPNVTLRYADDKLVKEVEIGMQTPCWGRTVNLVDVLHFLDETLAEYCSEPSASRWWQIDYVMIQLQAEYKRNGLKYATKLHYSTTGATDTTLADRLMSAIDERRKAIVGEIEANDTTDFSDVALEIDAVLQCKTKARIG
jgi:hypothetical protein